MIYRTCRTEMKDDEIRAIRAMLEHKMQDIVVEVLDHSDESWLESFAPPVLRRE